MNLDVSRQAWTAAELYQQSFTEEHVVFFDAVGTVLAVEPSVAELYRRAGEELGLSLPHETVDQRFQAALRGEADSSETDPQQERDRWRRIVANVLCELEETQADLAFERLWDRFADPKHWSVYPGVEPLWKKLKQQGVRIGIASNFDERLKRICRSFPLLDAADHLFYSSELGVRKPSARFYQTIAARIDWPPNKLHMVGDSHAGDVVAAVQAGWTATWLPDGLHAFST